VPSLSRHGAQLLRQAKCEQSEHLRERSANRLPSIVRRAEGLREDTATEYPAASDQAALMPPFGFPRPCGPRRT